MRNFLTVTLRVIVQALANGTAVAIVLAAAFLLFVGNPRTFISSEVAQAAKNVPPAIISPVVDISAEQIGRNIPAPQVTVNAPPVLATEDSVDRSGTPGVFQAIIDAVMSPNMLEKRDWVRERIFANLDKYYATHTLPAKTIAAAYMRCGGLDEIGFRRLTLTAATVDTAMIGQVTQTSYGFYWARGQKGDRFTLPANTSWEQTSDGKSVMQPPSPQATYIVVDEVLAFCTATAEQQPSGPR